MMAAPSAGRLNVRAVEGRRDLQSFVRLPWKIYQDHPCWVPPLIMERLQFIDPRRNPFFRHSEAQLMLAERDGEPVGRIAAIRNQRHLDVHGDGVGFFGFFESIDDAEVAAALVERAEGWLRGQGLRRIRGPMSFTINDESGLLINAFDLPPVLLMPYNPPYYPHLIEQCGLAKAHDLIAFRMFVPESIPPRLVEAEDKIRQRFGIVVRQANLKRFDEEVEKIHHIHSQAWAENWGAVPLTQEEMHHMASDLRRIVDPELVHFAELDGEPVGISVSVPDMNQALRHANGRLFPSGLLRILWHQRHIDALRVLIMGVVKEWRLRGVDAAMYSRTITTGLAKGYRWGELSWILESNRPMLRVLERLGAEPYKTYRVYEKAL